VGHLDLGRGRGTAWAAAAVVGDDRYREQWEVDVAGARELGMSPLKAALGALVAAVVIPSKGTVMVPVGPLAIALEHAKTPRGRVLVIAVVFAVLLLCGVALSFA
jgi:hypothetical protein